MQRWSWATLGTDKRAWKSAIRAIDKRLNRIYHSPRLGNLSNPTDELFYILLSKKTPAKRYRRVFVEMRRSYKPWELLLDANRREIEQLLKPLGFSKVRAGQILKIARQLDAEFGRVSLLPLRGRTKEETKSYLKSLPGVGEKSARCVMMFSMNFDISPMDTHTTRVLRRLGLLPHDCVPAASHVLMDKRLPRGMSRRLHVNLISHGRAICRTQRPRCTTCCFLKRCYSGTSMSKMPSDRGVETSRTTI